MHLAQTGKTNCLEPGLLNSSVSIVVVASEDTAVEVIAAPAVLKSSSAARVSCIFHSDARGA